MSEFAQFYTSTSAPQVKDGQDLIELVKPKKNSRVLDLGCGTGYLTSVLAEQVGPAGYVIGVEPDSERLALARKEYAMSNLTFVEGSSDDIPGGPYDLIFSNCVFHWVKDKKLAFKNVHRNLTQGGCFALTALLGYTPLERKVFALVGREPEVFVHCGSFDEYVKIAEDCGFEVETKAVEQRTISFPNIDAYLDFNSASIGNEGKYDHRDVDPEALAEFKRPFGDTAVETLPPHLTLILRKI